MTDLPSSKPTPPADDSLSLEKLRPYFLGAAIALVLFFVTWGGIMLFTELAIKKVQKEYLALTDDASRMAFAKRNVEHPLGGLVLLEQANKYYSNGDYAAARSAYAEALASGLKSQPVLWQQALLGEAFASYALDTPKGIEALAKIAQNSTLLEGTRAHAAAELAGYYAETKDFAKSRDYVRLLKTFKDARPWAMQAESLEEVYPELRSAPSK